MQLAYHNMRLGYQLDYMMEHCLLAVAFFLPLSLEITSVFLGIGALLWLAKIVIRRTFCFEASPFDAMVALFVVLSGVSVLAAPDRGFSFYNYYQLMGRYIFTYYLIIHNIQSSGQLKRMVWALLLSGGLVALYGFYQYFFGIDLSVVEWVDGSQFPDLKTRIFSTLKNPNLLAGFLVGMMALASGIAISSSDRRQQAALAALVLLFGGCLVLTYSRGAWVSLLAVIGVFGCLRNRRIFWLLVLLPLLVIVGHDAVVERLLSIFNPTDTSSTLRLALWESTWAMIVDFPLTGIGWGAYWQVYPNYDFFMQNGTKIFHAHNMYLNIAAEIGIPGFLAFAGILVGHVRLALRLEKQPCGWGAGFALGAAAFLASLAVNGLTDYIMFNIRISMLFWLINALIVVAARQASR